MIRVENNLLHIDLTQWEKMGALTRSFSVPLDSIAWVHRVKSARKSIRGMRAPGTAWPGRIALGRWRTLRTVDFVSTHRNEPGYIIELADQRFNRLVISSEPVPELDALATHQS